VTILSRSKYLSDLQRWKLLWFDYNAKEEFQAPDEATQAIFDLTCTGSLNITAPNTLTMGHNPFVCPGE
jgi:hypothetical protein